MMMKKKLAALLLAAAGAMVFTGCGSDDNQSKGGVDKKVQIEYWHVAASSFITTVKELVADFNTKHPNIQVVEKYNPDMYKGLTQNLQAAIAPVKSQTLCRWAEPYLNYAAENLKYTDLQPMISRLLKTKIS